MTGNRFQIHYNSDNDDDELEYYNEELEYYNEEPDYEEDEYELDSAHEWSGGYHPNFPVEWRTNYLSETGPEECLNCAAFGCYQGDFIGYCANCAARYCGTRGRGFIDVCMEFDNPTTRQWTSVFETYLCGCDFARFCDEEQEYLHEWEIDDNYHNHDHEHEHELHDGEILST